MIQSKLDSADWIGTSVVCAIEFFSFSDLINSDKELFLKLYNRVSVIPVSNDVEIIEQIGQLRIQTKLKIPDAIIATSAIKHNCILISNDKHFNNIPQHPVCIY